MLGAGEMSKWPWCLQPGLCQTHVKHRIDNKIVALSSGSKAGNYSPIKEGTYDRARPRPEIVDARILTKANLSTTQTVVDC